MTMPLQQQWRRAAFFRRTAKQAPQNLLPKDHCSTSKKRVTKSFYKQICYVSQEEADYIEAKAQRAKMSISGYLRSITLGPDYQSPHDPERIGALLKLNRELTIQGHQLKQIAEHLNSGTMNLEESMSLLKSLRDPLVKSLKNLQPMLVLGHAVQLQK